MKIDSLSVKQRVHEFKVYLGDRIKSQGLTKTILFVIAAPAAFLFQWIILPYFLFKFSFAIPWEKIIKFIFLNDKNQLNSVGTTSAISVILLGINIWYSGHRSRKEIIIKARTEGINLLRDQLAIFSSKTKRYIYLKLKFKNKYEDSADKEITEVYDGIINSYYQIRFYTPDSGYNHAPILFRVISIYNHLQGYEVTEKNFEKINLEIESLISCSEQYFEGEWNRTKKGK